MRVHFHTFGCKANQYDTELVRQALADAGAVAVDDARDADFTVVNSCTVTHTGEAKMRGLVRRVNRANPTGKTVIMGCAAALDREALEALPGVHAVVPGGDPRAVLGSLGLPATAVSDSLRSFAGGARAWIKVQDGCDEHCTFCATTVARGASRSREVADVVAEARQLAGSHAELVVTGVHIGAYGRDLAETESLGSLLERMIDEVPDVRFRLSSVEATELDDRLAELMVSCPDRLAPHVHAPLQSGSDRILKLMGRNWYDSRSYRDRIERLGGRLDRFGLGADVMVGFPGETEADHRETLSVVRDLPYTYLHVFPYSERDVAPARHLGPPVAPALAAARSQQLRETVAARRVEYSRSRSGEVCDVVLTSRRNGVFQGITGDYLAVSVADPPARQRFEARLEWRDERLHAVPAVGVAA